MRTCLFLTTLALAGCSINREKIALQQGDTVILEQDATLYSNERLAPSYCSGIEQGQLVMTWKSSLRSHGQSLFYFRYELPETVSALPQASCQDGEQMLLNEEEIRRLDKRIVKLPKSTSTTNGV